MNILSGRWRLGKYILVGHAGSTEAEITYPLLESGYAVMVYNTSGELLAIFSSEIENNPLIELEFKYADTGCSSFSLSFSEIPTNVTLTYNTRIDIHLYGDSNPWYSGYITVIPKAGTTATTFTYEGYGYYDQLANVIINETYTSMEISDIVGSIMTNTVEPYTDIVYKESKLYDTSYIVSKLKFKHVTAKSAIEDLADYATSYVCGVDEYRQLYFKPVDTDINSNCYFFVGKNTNTFEPEESIEDLKNYLYIKASSTYVTALSAAVSSTSATSMNVKSVSKIAVGDTLTIDDEEVYVSAISGTVLTVTRAYNDTTAATHDSGALVANNYETTLSAAITSTSDTTIYVAKNNWMLVGDTLSIDSEKMYISAISGTTLTVTRGYNSTTAATHSSGVTVEDTTNTSTSNRIIYTCSDSESISTYGRREDVLTIPSAMAEDDAQRWGDYKLQSLKDPTVTAELEYVNPSQTLIKAEGYARVTSADGENTYDLAIVETTYNVSASDGIKVSLSLGALPNDALDNFVAAMVRQASVLEATSSEED